MHGMPWTYSALLLPKQKDVAPLGKRHIVVDVGHAQQGSDLGELNLIIEPVRLGQ